MTENIEALLAAVAFDGQGLVPVIAQDADTGVVRVLAWANAEALRASAKSGLATFWSRSRNELWQKGATSGNFMRVTGIRIDCDGDAVLYSVRAEGPSCHTGTTSCFFRTTGSDGAIVSDDGPSEPGAAILARVAGVIAARRKQEAGKSYVASLLAAGWPKINGKITEEAGEVTEAFVTGDRADIAHEAADVIFHLMVGLEMAGVGLDDVFTELKRRFGTSGLVEKASRGTASKA